MELFLEMLNKISNIDNFINIFNNQIELMAGYDKLYDQKKIVNLPNGDTYEGYLNGKMKHGFGIYKYSNGDVYEG